MLSIHEYVQGSVHFNSTVYTQGPHIQLDFQFCTQQALNNDRDWPQMASRINVEIPKLIGVQLCCVD